MWSVRPVEQRRNTGMTTEADNAQKMVRSWMMFAAPFICLLVCLSSFSDAYPPKPESPGGNASPEDWDRYHAAVRHYVNLITRQRYGKRSTPEQEVAWLLLGADSNHDTEPRLDYENQW